LSNLKIEIIPNIDFNQHIRYTFRKRSLSL
jgi:hypothetical protein